MIGPGTVLRLKSPAGDEGFWTILEAIEPSLSRLSQRDPRWAGKKLGFTTGGETIGSHGCLITCMTKMLGRADVGAFNDELTSRRMFVAGTGLVFLDLAAFGFKLAHNSPLFDKVEMPIEWMGRLGAHLKAGTPAIIGVDFQPWPSNAQYDEHYVLATGIDGKGQIQIADPWPTPDEAAPLTLSPRYGKTNGIAVCRVLLYEPTGGNR